MGGCLGSCDRLLYITRLRYALSKKRSLVKYSYALCSLCAPKYCDLHKSLHGVSEPTNLSVDNRGSTCLFRRNAVLTADLAIFPSVLPQFPKCGFRLIGKPKIPRTRSFVRSERDLTHQVSLLLLIEGTPCQNRESHPFFRISAFQSHSSETKPLVQYSLEYFLFLKPSVGCPSIQECPIQYTFVWKGRTSLQRVHTTDDKLSRQTYLGLCG